MQLKNDISRLGSLCTLLLVTAACGDRLASPSAATDSRQAALQSELTLTGATDGGTHSYTATLPPATVVGTISQSLEGSWNTNLHGISQTPIYPDGWSLDYYAGAAKLARAPATASEWSQVSRIVTTGNISVQAVDGDRQALIATASAPPPVVASTFSGGSAGDGWDVFFDPEYTRVFNIHHHASPATVMCRNLADSTPCPGYPIALSTTSNRSTGRIDAGSRKLWQPTVISGPTLAWDCVDLTTAKRCAIPTVASASTAASASYDTHIDPVVIGRKMYAIGFVTGGARITCLDMATGTECPGIALPQNGGAATDGLAAVGNRLYVLPGFNKNLDCYDSTTGTRCPGSWPVTAANLVGPVWGVRSADSAVHNVCTSDQCFALDGSAHTLPPNFAAYLATHRAGAYLASNGYQYGRGASLNTKAVWPVENERLACWDMATDAACAPAFLVTVPRVYTATLDPEDPDCVWTNGDDGIIRNYKMSTGAAGCSGGPPRISFKATVSIPRLGCDPGSRVYQYKSFRLLAPNPTQYTSATLTVKDADGVPITGWINVPLPAANPVVDLTALTPALAGDAPTFVVAAAGFTDTTVVPTGEFRVVTGATPQLCWELAVPSLTCPNLPGLAGNATPGAQSTLVTAKGSFANGGSVTRYTDQMLSATVNANPPNFNNCGGTNLTVKVVSLFDGSPVAGAPVSLFDNAGNPILDPATQQPVSVVSAADGTVSFPVWAASYTLKFNRSARHFPVTMTVTAGGSGTTVPSNGAVVSNTVTTTAGNTAHVDIVVDVDNEPPCAPVVTSPPGGTVVYTGTTPLTGTAEAGSTVVVKVNGQSVCTVVASAQGQWSCNAALPLGTNTVTATSTDAAGNTSSPSTAVSITRRNDIDPPVITGPSGTVNGPGATVTGTAKPAANITVKDEVGNTVCTTVADNNGAWQCDGTFKAGPQHLTADAEWSGFTSTSSPHDFTVLLNAWYQGTSCSSTGGAPPALMLLLTLAGLLAMRRRARLLM